EPGRLEHLRAVGARRDDGAREAPVTDGADEPDRARKGPDTVALDHREHERVLAVPEPADRVRLGWVAVRPLRQHDAPGAEERTHAVEALAAVDVFGVVPQLERRERRAVAACPRAEEGVERLLPGAGVDGRRV